MPPHVHVIGGGLAGLSAATALAEQGAQVTLSEAAPQLGGRCRSYHDAQLGLTIDNGNHLVLAGNHAVAAYLARIGAQDCLTGPTQARFPWIDLRTGQRWHVHPNPGRVPWWLLVPARRAPGTTAKDHLALFKLARARPGRTIGELLPTTGPLWDRLLRPLLVSILNTEPSQASAALAGAVIRESLGAGGVASAPRIATPTLAAAFVDPALAYLRDCGATVRTGMRLKAIDPQDDGNATLRFSDGTADVVHNGAVVLAVPAWTAADLIPGLSTPTRHHAILNAHFAAPPPRGAESITGLTGGTAEWVFTHADRISLTVSAADRLVDALRDALAAELWRETKAALRLAPDTPMPAHRIVVEKRATFSATPEEDARRPGPRTRHPNVFLAGDWTQTGLPATIEGAIRSGHRAAALALGGRSG